MANIGADFIDGGEQISFGRDARLDLKPPTPVQPYPLLRMLTDPAFDHGGHHLHRPGDVDLAGCIAWRLERFGQLERKAVAGKADRTCAMDRAVEQTGKTGDRRAHEADDPAQERHRVGRFRAIKTSKR
jgi:hypothetical protein